MSIKKIVITKGIYKEKELRLLVSFDEKDKPLDIINLDVTKVGTVCEATVEKVLNDIDASILKLSTGDKGFIENIKLKPEFFTVRHSEKKLVCQEDKFWVEISQDKKGSKPFSCKFIEKINEDNTSKDFIDYFFSKYASPDCDIISDVAEVIKKNLNVRPYVDEEYSLWNLYGFTKLLDSVTSKIVYLKNGGNIVIEQTEALTVVDVNSAKNGGKATFMETNIQAIDALVSQLRLRSLSGIIIVDLLKVSKDEEAELREYFKELCKDDISSMTGHGFTNLGLFEITRSRIFSPFNI